MPTITSSTSSLVTYLGDGATRDFTFSFPYLDPSHVHAYVDGVEVSFTLLRQQFLRLSVAPGTGSVVLIQRETPDEDYVVIPDAGVITTEILQANEDQARYIAIEARDIAEPALRYDATLQAYNARNRRIGRLASADLGNDAVNKSDVEVEVARFVGGDALATIVSDMTGLAGGVHDDRVDVDLKAAQMALDVATAQALAIAAANGPDGATIVQRINDYLGTTSWQGEDPSDGGAGLPAAGAHRYWRWQLRQTQDNVAQYLSITNLQFRTAAGVNQTSAIAGVPLSKQSQASSPWGSESNASTYPTDDANGSFDGPITAAQTLSGNSILGYYFDVARAVVEVSIKVHNGDQSPRLFFVEWSDDGSAWTSTTGTTPFYKGAWQPATGYAFTVPASGSHRYWRIRITDVSRVEGVMYLYEMQFRAALGVSEDHAATTQVANPGPSAQWSAQPQFLVDGLLTGTQDGVSVNGQFAAPEEVNYTVDFTTPRFVAEFALTVGATSVANLAPMDYDILFSDDNISYTLAMSVTGQRSWADGSTRTNAMPSVFVPVSSATYVWDADALFTRPPKGRIAFIQAWGAGGANNGGGGSYNEVTVRLRSLPDTVPVTVGLGVPNGHGGTSSFGSILQAAGGELSGRGANSLGVGVPYTGEGLSGPNPTGGIYCGGGGNPSGTGASSLYGGGGGGPVAGGLSAKAGRGGYTSVPPLAPAGGGGPSQPGAKGRVQMTIW